MTSESGIEIFLWFRFDLLEFDFHEICYICRPEMTDISEDVALKMWLYVKHILYKYARNLVFNNTIWVRVKTLFLSSN